MISAPASAARTVSGTSPPMYMTLQPAWCARSKYPRKSWSTRAHANDATAGFVCNVTEKRSSSTSKSRWLMPKGLSVARRIASTSDLSLAPSIPDVPRIPRPPLFETAATSGAPGAAPPPPPPPHRARAPRVQKRRHPGARGPPRRPCRRARPDDGFPKENKSGCESSLRFRLFAGFAGFNRPFHLTRETGCGDVNRRIRIRLAKFVDPGEHGGGVGRYDLLRCIPPVVARDETE